MTLREARCAFTFALSKLVLEARNLGYEPAFAEGMDRVTEKDPTTDHMKGSLHELGLAQDIDLYKDGKYLEKTEDHTPLGEYWEALGKTLGWPLAWGGRFKDGNHYSLAWGGKK
jgi:hypothetical protein